MLSIMSDLFSYNKYKDKSYEASDIEVLQGLDPVKKRPGMYIGGNDLDALHHLFNEVLDWEAVEAGLSYVSGDLTFTAMYRDSDSIDDTAGNTPSGVKDGIERTGLSVDYAVASGVTTTVGFINQSATNEGTKEQTNSGSSWYIGTNLSF